jgi:putative transposase
MLLKSFKTKLNPNNKHKTLFARHAGTARHAWNWGLDVCLKALKNKQKLPTAIDLHKRLVSEVKQAYPWYYEVSKCSPQQALRNLSLAFSRWLKQQIARSPKRKKKGVKDSFYLEGSIGISGNLIKLPRIGWVKCHEILPAVTVKNVTISKRAGDWYISFKYEHEIKPTPKLRERIGVDVGINRLATCSDGTEVANVLAYRKAKRRLIQLQRAVTRSREGSKNRLKAIRQLARQHRFECFGQFGTLSPCRQLDGGSLWRLEGFSLRTVRVGEARNRHQLRHCPKLSKFCRAEGLLIPKMYLVGVSVV